MSLGMSFQISNNHAKASLHQQSLASLGTAPPWMPDNARWGRQRVLSRSNYRKRYRRCGVLGRSVWEPVRCDSGLVHEFHKRYFLGWTRRLGVSRWTIEAAVNVVTLTIQYSFFNFFKATMRMESLFMFWTDQRFGTLVSKMYFWRSNLVANITTRCRISAAFFIYREGVSSYHVSRVSYQDSSFLWDRLTKSDLARTPPSSFHTIILASPKPPELFIPSLLSRSKSRNQTLTDKLAPHFHVLVNDPQRSTS